MKDSPNTDQSALLTQAQIKALLVLAMETSPVPPGVPVSEIRTANAQAALDDLGTQAGESCEDILARVTNAATSLDDLRSTKELAKRLAAGAKSRIDRDAAALLYHVSVAAALCGHGVHISNQPFEHRQAMYRRLARLFSGEAIGAVFQKASE